MSKKILLIEDDADQIMMYQTALNIGGVASLVATTGESGLAMAKDYQPAVIVLDIVMEGLAGEAVLKKLKADPATKHIPVIVFTNLDKKRIKEDFLAWGADEFIGKTQITPSELVARVKGYLSD